MPLCLIALLVMWLVEMIGGESVCTPDESTKSPCVCTFNNGSKIDLRSIKERLTTFDQDNSDIKYDYNPCYPFTISDGCDNVLLCQNDNDDFIPLGRTGDYVSFGNEPHSNNLYIQYVIVEDHDHSYSRSEVFLECDHDYDSANFSFVSYENDHNIYQFTLISKCACADGCKPPPPAGHKSKSHPGIVGIILLSILVAGVLVYFITGSAIMKFKYRATGSDIIPNKLFWMSLPSLVKDGVLFIVSPCVKVCQRKGYTKVDD